GLDVEIADNGRDAIEKTKSGSFDLVLMDIQMPVLDGYNAVKLIRDTVSKSLPVIAMTAHTMEGEREKCMSYGMNDYISKPFTELELFGIVSKYIGKDHYSEAKSPVSTPSLPPSGHVDLEQLFSLSRGNNAFIKEMIGIFLEQNPQDLDALASGIAAKDFETIRAVSHKMKTSLGFMGMAPMLTPLSTIERLSSGSEGLEEISAEFQTIKTTCKAAAEELKQVLINLKLT
ncbi:MAG: response regulator, partial [Bacteroidia bacterium]